MTKLDISKMQNSSLTPGIQDLGSIPDIVQTFSGTIPISGQLTTSINVPFPTSKVISLMRIKVQGGSLGAYWFPLPGTLGLSDFTNLAARTGGYYIFLSVLSSPTGRTVSVQIQNETVGATVTLPTLTFTLHTHLYNYAW